MTSNSPQKRLPPPPLPEAMLRDVVKVLKEASLHRDFLDDFRWQFVFDIIVMYKKFGDKFSLTDKQLAKIWELKKFLMIE